MWLFWVNDVEIAWYNINILGILDTFVILLIIGITIYVTRKKNKENRWEDTDSKIWIDEQKWFIVETSVKKNIDHYNEVKLFFSSAFSVPSLLLLTVVDLFWLWYSLYEILTNKANTENIISLILFIIFLLVIIFLFLKLKKTLGGFFFKIIKMISIMFLFLIIIFLWRLGWSFIVDNLKLDEWLSALIELIFFLLIFLWVAYAFFTVFLKYITPKNSPKNDWKGKVIDDITNEWIDKELTYDELVDSNKKLEEKTWFHQWSLLE